MDKSECEVEVQVPDLPVEKYSKSRLRFLLVGLFVVPIILVGLLSPPSTSGFFYLTALAWIWLGPLLAKHVHVNRYAPYILRYGGYTLLLAVLTARTIMPQGMAFRYEQVGASSFSRACLARFVNERDLSGVASTLLNALSLLPPRGAILGELFRETHDLMDAATEEGLSPLISTLLLGQSAESFDMLHYRVDNPRGTVVFLHGYGGNIASICWEVAQSAKAVDFSTRCPSTRTQGDWSSFDGRAIVEATLDGIEDDGIEGPIVLVGLSAGAHGAALLAPHLREQIDGLVLLAGAARAARAQVPTLVIYGARDAMFPPEIMRAYAANTGARAITLNAGHFIVLSERERIRSELAAFFEARL